MRAYFTTGNFIQAAALAAIVTLASVGRLCESELPLVTGVVMLFFCMLLVCAFVTAWGRRAGMAGIWTDRRTLSQGLLTALILGVICWLPFLLGVDARLRAALAGSPDGTLLHLVYPTTRGTQLALGFWVAGFQTLFLVAAPMSFAARLTGSRYAALGFCLFFRLWLSHRQVVEAGITEHLALLMTPSTATSLLGCLLFARFGLAPAALFSAVLCLRLLLPVSP